MVYIDSDHAGFNLKHVLIEHFKEKKIDFIDCGFCHSKEKVCDYPDVAKNLCAKLLKKEESKGILICGTGVGMAIAANKIKGIRAVSASDYFSTKYSRLHNDANIFCIGARVLGNGLALELVDIFLNTKFEGGRHLARVKKIEGDL